MALFFQRSVSHHNAHDNVVFLIGFLQMLACILMPRGQGNFIKIFLPRPKMQVCVYNFSFHSSNTPLAQAASIRCIPGPLLLQIRS